MRETQDLYRGIAIVAAGLGAWIMSLPAAILALMILTAVDFGTGTVKASITGKWSSDAGRKGAAKHAAMFLWVFGVYAVARVGIAKYPGLEGLDARSAEWLALYHCFIQVGSIVENLGVIGVPVPAPITSAMAVFRGKLEAK